MDGLGGKTNGMPREDGYDITVASEVMAVLCLASDINDLKARLARLVVAYTRDGKPAAMMLMGKNATVTVCHTKTVNTAEICKGADIIVSAAGVLNSLTADFVRPGQIVIDVSINWDANKPNAKGGLGGIAGDAKFDEVEPIVDAITPVPGGVGSVTTSVLMKHVVEAAERV